MKNRKQIGNSTYSPSYEFSMRDAHRKPAQPVSPPALTRCLGFRRDDIYNSGRQWIERLELLIIEVIRALIEKSSKEVSVSNLSERPTYSSFRGGKNRSKSWEMENIDLMKHRFKMNAEKIERIKVIKPESSRYETVVIHGTWREMPIIIRFELFSEFFCISTVVDFRVGGGSFSEFFSKIIDEISSDLNEKPIPRKSIIAKNIRRGVHTLYNKMWDDFDGDIFSTAFSNMTDEIAELYNFKNDVDSHAARARQIKVGSEIFSDFRGMVFGLDSQSGWEKIRKPGEDKNAEQKLRHHERVNAAATQLKGDAGIGWAEKVFPVLLAMDPHHVEGAEIADSQNREFELTEYTFSTFDGGRCLYGSSFGPQDPDSPTPLYYVLVVAHDDHRQLGSLINRLHLLGSSRMAALFDFDKIIYFSGLLSFYSTELHNLAVIADKKSLSKRKKDACWHAQRSMEILKTLSRDLRGRGKINEHFNEADRKQAKELGQYFLRDVDLIMDEAISFFDRKESGELPPNIADGIAKILENMDRFKKLMFENDGLKQVFDEISLLTKDKADKAKKFSNSIIMDLKIVLCHDVDSYKKFILESAKVELEKMDAATKFGIAHRAERSKYYQNQFSYLVDAMRIHNIEGYQQYDIFVQHRMTRAFNIISAISERHKLVQATVNSLEEKEVALENARRIEEQRKLMIFGEWITVLIIVPHYFDDLLHKILYNPNMPHGGGNRTIQVWFGVVVAYILWKQSENIFKYGRKLLQRYLNLKKKFSEKSKIR